MTNQKYARLSGGLVAEIIDLPSNVPLEDAFHPDLVAEIIKCDASVVVGSIFDGQNFIAPTLDVQPIATVKSALKVAIDAEAETERLKYITPGNGQSMTYQQKVTEAQAFKAETNPKAADYPILSSEVGITAETLAEVADIVLAAFSRWKQIGAAIESIRLGAKRDIDAAEDETAARAVVDAIVWPQPAI